MHPIVEKIIVTLSLVTGFFTGSIWLGERDNIGDVLISNGREPLDFSAGEEDVDYGDLLGRIEGMVSDDSGGLKRFLEMTSLENKPEIIEKLRERCGELLKSKGGRGDEKYELAKQFCSKEAEEWEELF